MQASIWIGIFIGSTIGGLIPELWGDDVLPYSGVLLSGGESEMTDRARAPKAKDYSVVPGSLGPRRDFRISVGLREVGTPTVVSSTFRRPFARPVLG